MTQDFEDREARRQGPPLIEIVVSIGLVAFMLLGAVVRLIG